MSTAGSRTDRFQGLRRYVARGVIVVYFFLLISVALTVADLDRSVLAKSGSWTAWLIGFVPLTVGFGAALKVLSAGDRGRSRRLTAVAAAMLLLGVTIIVGNALLQP
jgi:hypothetical protein